MSALPLFERDESLKKALVIVAHPDDVDFGAAGTIAVLTRSGVDVSYCLITSGDAGGDTSTLSREERAAIREDEQRAAAAAVGVTNLTFLGWPDGMVEVTLELRRALARVIRLERPDLVITQSPERNYDRIFASHPDHLATGEAAMRAVYPDARNPHAFVELLDEGLEPHTVSRVWISGFAPTMTVDITDTIDAKLAALHCHVSQVGHRDDLDDQIRAMTRANAVTAGLGEDRYSENYRVVVTA